MATISLCIALRKNSKSDQVKDKLKLKVKLGIVAIPLSKLENVIVS
jgi:hypothetical protein